MTAIPKKRNTRQSTNDNLTLYFHLSEQCDSLSNDDEKVADEISAEVCGIVQSNF